MRYWFKYNLDYKSKCIHLNDKFINEERIKMAVSKKNENIKKANNQIDFILLIDVLLMLALGIVMVMSASSPTSLSETGKSYTYVKTQAISAVMGLIGMFVVSKIDYKIYKKFYKIIYIAIIILLASVAVIGHSVGGAKRWIDLGFISFQPSELAKIALIIFYASLLTNNKERLDKLWGGFFYPIAFLLPIIAILIGVQNHLSATVLIVMIVAVMMLMAGSRLRYFLSFGLAGAGIGGVALLLYARITGSGSFRIQRLVTFMNPFADTQGSGWQIIQSLYAIGSGGLFGVGLGNSTQKYLYLPEAHNDFIFSIIAEELGFAGCLAVIIMFAIFIWRGIIIAMKAPDMFSSLIAVGITTMVGLQAIINIAVVTSSMPNTGMPLPFFSYVGTALLILLCSVGILLNISRCVKR